MQILNFIKKYLYNFLIGLIIFFGIYLRFKGYWANPSFWHDECGLAWNIKFKNYYELFGILRFLQVAPPFFLVLTKFLTQIFGYSEKVFRFIPFLAGCLSIPAFYLLSKKALNNKISVVFAVFFFAVNERVINYSVEFKPYILDVFLVIICLLFFINIDIEKLNKKLSCLYGVLLSIIPWFSFISVFFLAGGFLNICLTHIKKNWIKKTFLIFPAFISGLLYLKFYILTNYNGTKMVSDWDRFFFALNPKISFNLFIESIKFLFLTANFYLYLILILFIWGVMVYFQEKSVYFKVTAFSLLFFIISSILHIYPFSGRVILFLIPVYLLFIIKPLDKISLNKKLLSFLLISLAVISFIPQIKWVKYFTQAEKTITKEEAPREVMKILNKDIKKEDIIFISRYTNIEFIYYYPNFYNIKNQVIYEKDKDNRIQLLNYIKKNSNCWFYFLLEDKRTDSLLKWLDENAKIITVINFNGLRDYLIYTHIK